MLTLYFYNSVPLHRCATVPLYESPLNQLAMCCCIPVSLHCCTLYFLYLQSLPSFTVKYWYAVANLPFYHFSTVPLLKHSTIGPLNYNTAQLYYSHSIASSVPLSLCTGLWLYCYTAVLLYLCTTYSFSEYYCCIRVSVNHLTQMKGVRIQYKCLVPIYLFPEMKLRCLIISKTELKCSLSQFPHSCICERFIYSQDWSASFATAK